MLWIYALHDRWKSEYTHWWSHWCWKPLTCAEPEKKSCNPSLLLVFPKFVQLHRWQPSKQESPQPFLPVLHVPGTVRGEVLPAVEMWCSRRSGGDYSIPSAVVRAAQTAWSRCLGSYLRLPRSINTVSKACQNQNCGKINQAWVKREEGCNGFWQQWTGKWCIQCWTLLWVRIFSASHQKLL